MRAQYGLGSKKKSKHWLIYLLFMAALAIGSLSYATQTVAAAYGFHPALGAPLFANVYWPWKIFIWSQLIADSHGIISETTKRAQLIFVLPQMLYLLLWAIFGRKPKGKKDVHGTAAWAGEKEIEKAGLLEGEGVYVGGWVHKFGELKYLRHNGPEHVMAFAPTRSGKGVGLVLPTLLSWPGSTIVLDIKGENWALSSGWRKSVGHTVFKFDPTDTTGTTARYNPLEEIRIGPRAIPDAQNIVTMIVDPDGKGLKDYWNKAAFSFLAGVVLHCITRTLAEEGRFATLTDLSFMMADENQEANELLVEMMEADQDETIRQHYPDIEMEYAKAIRKFIAASAREMRNKAGTELSGVLSTAVANLALYRDPVVAKATSSCDFHVKDLMNGDTPVSLYLVIPPSDVDRLQPLMRLFMNVILRRLTEGMDFEGGRAVAGYNHRLLLMFDEFRVLGKLDIFERALAFMGGYGIKAYIIVQDIAQLHSIYGKEESIMSNCHIRVAYAPNKLETAKELSGMTGQTTVLQKKVSLSGNRSGHLNRANVNISETARPLLTVDECQRLPGPKKNSTGDIIEAGDMLIFPSGFSPIYGRQILYFIDPEFSRRSRIEAPLKSDSLATETIAPAPERSQAIDTEAAYEEHFE